MAWPFLFEENFELGTFGRFDSETDTGALLNYRHYSYLAREDVTKVGGIAPWRGAYCVEWNLGDTNDHILIEADLDVADAATRYSRFYIFLGKDLRATSDDVFSIYELQGTANAQESVVALSITAATQAVLIGTAQVPGDIVFSGEPLPRGKWICIELATADVIGSATGTSQLFVDGVARAAVTHAAVNTVIARGVLGTQDTLSTTTGHVYMDAFVFDDTRIYPHSDRYPDTMWITQSQHICLGYSELLNVTLLPGAEATNTLKIYDTDCANVNDESNVVAQLYNLTISEPPIDLADVPVDVKRGAFVQLATGTANDATGKMPRALVHIGKSQGYRSHGRVRQFGASRTIHNLATQ